MITFQTEPWAKFWPDAQAIFHQHWRELALYQDEIPIDVDAEKYAKLDALGILLIVTGREDGRLIGYYLWYLMPHPHYAGSGPMGMTDMYFILPEYRHGAGAKLFIESESQLRKRGIGKAVTSCKIHQDHSAFFERMGWTKTDFTFCKLIGGR